eukprot:COSAG01_NODE_4243_length_5211_cov_7.043232_6_plen_64_part_00
MTLYTNHVYGVCIALVDLSPQLKDDENDSGFRLHAVTLRLRLGTWYFMNRSCCEEWASEVQLH